MREDLHGAQAPVKHSHCRKACAPRILPPVTSETLLTKKRKALGLTVAQVAEAVGTDQANLWRIEKGEQTPKRDLARKLHAFYGGALDIGAIYDPTYKPKRAAA